MKYRVLVTCPHLQRTLHLYRAWFRRRGIVADAPPVRQQLSATELLKIIPRYDGVIAGDDLFTAAVLRKGKAHRLKTIAKWGIGVDRIDVEEAGKLGISVSRTPGVFGEDVADVVVGYLVLLARRLHAIDQAVRKGRWLKIEGTSLAGKTAGIVGVGSIGLAVARRLSAMRMKLLGCDPKPIDARFCRQTGLRQSSLDGLLRRSDCVILCCSLTPGTRNLLSARRMGRLKKGAWVINVSRGALVDEKALVAALRTGRVAGAALEVFEREPIGKTHPLTRFERVILGCHNASNTREAVRRVNKLVLQNLLKGLKRK